MNSDSSDFDQLRKLLALKRHEQPPPGYFRRLPDQIATRLERGEGKSFWEGFLSQVIYRPALAYSFALAAFSALTLSVIYSIRIAPQEAAQAPRNGWKSGAESDAMVSQADSTEPLHVPGWMGSDNASNLAPALPSLFDSNVRQPAMQVHFASP